MGRASFVAILGLLVCGAAGIACTNSQDDFGLGGESSSGNTTSSRKRGANPASGDIGGDPETPSEQTLNGADDPNDDPSSAQADAAPPPSNDPGATPPPPDPNPDPGPNPDPIPPGSFAVGTELVTTANLNIRAGADTSYAIEATAPKGSIVIVETVSGANGWVNISWNGTIGWSSKSYLTTP